MTLETEKRQAVPAEDDEIDSRPRNSTAAGDDAPRDACDADALDDAVMSKLDRLAEELRALGIEF